MRGVGRVAGDAYVAAMQKSAIAVPSRPGCNEAPGLMIQDGSSCAPCRKTPSSSDPCWTIVVVQTIGMFLGEFLIEGNGSLANARLCLLAHWVLCDGIGMQIQLQFPGGILLCLAPGGRALLAGCHVVTGLPRVFQATFGTWLLCSRLLTL